MNKSYIGSDFDDLLKEEGILEQTERVAIKRVLAMRVKELMDEEGISKTEMAHRMQTSRAALDRLLDPENQSVTLQTMDRAAHALGKQLHLVLA